MKRILCFGDSNTWGHNPDDFSQIEKAWPVILKTLLPECEIIQDGKCGRTTAYGEYETNGIDVFRDRYIKNNSDFNLIVIMLGTNDTLKEFDRTPKETAESLQIFIDEWRGKYGGVTEFLFISPIRITQDALSHPVFKDLYDETAITKSECFKDAISQMAKQTAAHFMDAAEAASPSKIDGIHMEPSEHEKLAHAVADKIKSILF